MVGNGDMVMLVQAEGEGLQQIEEGKETTKEGKKPRSWYLLIRL
jgi:hypothetical protein